MCDIIKVQRQPERGFCAFLGVWRANVNEENQP